MKDRFEVVWRDCSFLPLAKFAFDFGRLPLHWPIAKFFLRILGYRELLTYPQRDIMAALRSWMMEETRQVTLFHFPPRSPISLLHSTMLTYTISGYLVHVQW